MSYDDNNGDIYFFSSNMGRETKILDMHSFLWCSFRSPSKYFLNGIHLDYYLSKGCVKAFLLILCPIYWLPQNICFSKILALGFDEKFIRTWEYYFIYCAAGFRSLTLGTYQVCLQTDFKTLNCNTLHWGLLFRFFNQ